MRESSELVGGRDTEREAEEGAWEDCKRVSRICGGASKGARLTHIFMEKEELQKREPRAYDAKCMVHIANNMDRAITKPIVRHMSQMTLYIRALWIRK